MTMKTLIPRRFFAFLCGLELFATLLLPPQAWALTTVEGTNGTHGQSTAAELDADTDQLMCSEAARGAVVNLPGGSVITLAACSTSTIVATDIGTTTPTAGAIPVAGTDGKLATGWMPANASTNTATGTMVLTGGTLTRVTGTGTATGTQTVTSVASTDTWTYAPTPSAQVVGSFSAIGAVWTRITGTGTSTGTATAASVASTDTATLTVTYTYTHTHTVTDVAGAVNTTDARLSDARHALDTLQVALGLTITSSTSTTTATSGTVSNTLTIGAPGYVTTSAQICAAQGNGMLVTGTQTATGTVTGATSGTGTATGSSVAYTGTSTMTSTVTSTGSASATVTASVTVTQTSTVTVTTTESWTMTGTGTGAQFGSATFTKIGTGTATSSQTKSQTTTYTAQTTATYSRTSTGAGTRTWTMTVTAALTAPLTATATATNSWTVTDTGTVTATGTTSCVGVSATPTVVGVTATAPVAPINTYVSLYLPQQISGGSAVSFCLGPNDTNSAGIPTWSTNGMQNAKTASPYLVPANGTIRSIYFGMAGAAISQGGPVSSPYMRIDIYRLNWNTTTLLQTLNVALDAAKTGINNATTSGNMIQTSVTSIGLAVSAGDFIGVVFVPQSGDNSKINAVLNLFGQMAITFP